MDVDGELGEIVVDDFYVVYLDGAGLEDDFFASAGEFVGVFAVDAHGGVCGWELHDFACELVVEEGAYCLECGDLCDVDGCDCSFEVIGVGVCAEIDRCAVVFWHVHYDGDGFCCSASYAEDEYACCEWVEGACVSGFGFACVVFDDADDAC